jgi:fructokinase
MASTMALMLMPEKIVFGGGVMSAALLPFIRQSTKEQLAGYLTHARLAGTLEEFITAPALGDRSGICGAIQLAATGISIGRAGTQ